MQLDTPIVVVDGKAKELSSAAEDFLDDSQVDIIGGKNSVSDINAIIEPTPIANCEELAKLERLIATTTAANANI
ncbi:hypothetical protein, partial [Clostridioides difficile]|uniref:hypothetical protein n=1 Tax=Clostridioides difficile TaxID=1496 RepID=UPI0023582B10